MTDFESAPEAGSIESSPEANASASESFAPDVVDRILKSQKFTPKVDGEVLEVDLDELLRGYSHGRAANKRIQQASEMSKQLEAERSLIEAAKNGDINAFKRLLGDDRAQSLSEQLLMGHIEWEQLPEAEQRAIIAERELEGYKQKELTAKEQQEKDAHDKAKAAALEEIDQDFGEALKKLGRKPTPRLLLRMAEDQVAHLSGESASSPMKADRVLKKVLGELETDISEYMADADAETMQRVLGDKAINTLRKHFAEAARSQDPLRSGRSQPSDASFQRRKVQAKKGSKDWWTNKEKLFNGR